MTCPTRVPGAKRIIKPTTAATAKPTSRTINATGLLGRTGGNETLSHSPRKGWQVEGATAGAVTLLAWPASDLLASAKVGDSVKIFPVGKAVVAGDGTFALKVDPSVPMQEVTEPDGIVNFDVLYEEEAGFAVYSFPRRQTVTDSGSAWVSVDGPSDVLDVTLFPDGTARDNQLVVSDATDKICGSEIMATSSETFGPVTNPSSDIDISKYTMPMDHA